MNTVCYIIIYPLVMCLNIREVSGIREVDTYLKNIFHVVYDRGRRLGMYKKITKHEGLGGLLITLSFSAESE